MSLSNLDDVIFDGPEAPLYVVGENGPELFVPQRLIEDEEDYS